MQEKNEGRSDGEERAATKGRIGAREGVREKKGAAKKGKRGARRRQGRNIWRDWKEGTERKETGAEVS